MSKNANPGELRVPVYFKTISRTVNNNGYPVEVENNIFGSDTPQMCKWVNAHGTESFTAMQLQLREPATITCRYTPLITAQCLVYKGSETEPYEIISIDNVEERNTWLEIKVQRREAAR